MTTSEPRPETSRQARMAALRATAINEALPLVERARAELERMRLVDEILDEQLAMEEQEGGAR